MAGITVGRTIGQSYGFVFRRVLSIVGFGWLPAAFFFAATYYLLERGGALVSSTSLPVDTREFDLLGGAGGLLILAAFFAAVVTVPIAQEALGLRQERALAHFVVGARELRLFRALLEVTVVVLSTAFVFGLVMSLTLRFGLDRFAHPNAVWHGIPLSLLATGAVAVATIAISVFLALRFGYFLPAIAAQEEKPYLARAWSLSRGSFWRLFAITLAIVVPFDLLLRGIEYAAYGAELRVVLAKTMEMGDPALFYQWVGAHAAQLALIASVALVMVSALFAGASAAAYRALAGADAAEEVTNESHEPWGVTATSPLESYRPTLAATPEAEPELPSETPSGSASEEYAHEAAAESIGPTEASAVPAEGAAEPPVLATSEGPGPHIAAIEALAEQPASADAVIVPELHRQTIIVPDEAAIPASPLATQSEVDPVTASFDARSDNGELSTPPSPMASANDLMAFDPALAGLPAIIPHESVPHETPLGM